MVFRTKIEKEYWKIYKSFSIGQLIIGCKEYDNKNEK